MGRGQKHQIDSEVMAEWLRKLVRPGDLVFTGCSDRTSKLICWGTQSPYSHVAVCFDEGVFVEAFDRSSSVNESDGGIFALTFEEFAARGTVIRVGLLRPDRIDEETLYASALRALEHSPSFASVGTLLMAAFGLWPQTNPIRRSRRNWMSAIAAWAAMRLMGDGPATVQCAEFATRLLATGNEPPIFPRLRLDGVAITAPREIQTLEDLPPRSAWTIPSEALPKRVTSFVSGISSRARVKASGDIGDFVVPGDLWTSPSFAVVVELKTGPNGRVEFHAHGE